MDKRTALKKNAHLRFPGMDCVIDAPAGRGGSVLTYTGTYPDQTDPRLLHRVLIRELFPYDPTEGIQRLENGDLMIPDPSRGLFESSRLSFVRANEIHLTMADSLPGEMDFYVGTWPLHNTLYSVLSFSGGRTLEEETEKLCRFCTDLSSGGSDSLSEKKTEEGSDRREANKTEKGPDRHAPEMTEEGSDRRASITTDPTLSFDGGAGTGSLLLYIVRIIRGALEILSAFHRAGYLHLDISPDNILIIGKDGRERVTLIDYNSVHRAEEVLDPSRPLSVKEGYSAPEIRLARRSQIGPQTDLYSMTAVFWKCLSGRDLTGLEWAGAQKPDPGALPHWQGLPETVLSMLRRILIKGLAPSPNRRYREVSEMLSDLGELTDRIRGRGITRWALWESGRARLRSLMQTNTALRYIREENRLFPLFAETEEGDRLELGQDLYHFSPDIAEDAVDGIAENTAESAATRHLLRPLLLLGSAGTGKTTALYRMAYETAVRHPRYSRDAAPVFYISLCGYRDGKDTFIRDSLLEGLKFKPETDSIESARLKLMQLLEGRPEKPGSLDTPAGRFRTPALYLLLDGWNEAGGDTAPLLEEIRLLASLPGVRILMTSRSDPGDPLFGRYRLCRLENADIRRFLAGAGIAPPENMEVFELLRIPLLLAAYIRTGQDGGRQPFALQSRDQLLEEYFSAIRQKEIRSLPEASDEAAGIDAVFTYLLPEIAACTKNAGQGVTDPDLLALVETCFQELSGRALTVVYPEWIGRTKALRLGADTADEWYGRAVLEILWQHAGLMVRDEHGNFRIFHQLMEDFLAQKSAGFHVRFDREKRRRRLRRNITAALAAGLSALVLVSAFGAYNYRMRMEIAHRHRLMIEAQQEKETQELIIRSGDRLDAGDRRGAVETARDALLLSCADPETAEQALLSEEGFARLRASADEILQDRQDAPRDDPQKDPHIDLRDDSTKDSGAARAQKALTDALGVYDLRDGFRSDFLLQLPGQPFRLFLSPQGTRVCALCPWQILVYDTADGKELFAEPIPQSALTQAAFLDEDRIVCAEGQALCAYDISAASADRLLWEIPGSAQVMHIALSADRTRIAAVDGEESRARILDADTGRELSALSFSGRSLHTPFRAVTGDPMDCMLTLNADGTCLAAGFSDGTVALFDWKEGTEKQHLLAGPSSLTRFKGGFCGDLFAWSASDGESSFCAAADVRTGQVLESFSADSGILLQADASGIRYADRNILYQWVPGPIDPSSGPAPAPTARALIRTEDVITSFCARSDRMLVVSGRNHFSFYTRTADPGSWTGTGAETAAYDCSFTDVEAQTAIVGSADADCVRILKNHSSASQEIFSYDPSYHHIEARLSADRETVTFFSAFGFRIQSLKTGEMVCEESFPDPDTIYDVRFCRPGKGDDGTVRTEEADSYLQAVWYDGTVRSYSAADGRLISAASGPAPDGSLREEFFTDLYRMVSVPGKPVSIYDRRTGEPVTAFSQDANLAYVTQAGDYIILEYFAMQDGSRYGILLNGDLETLARLPGLCDILEDTLIFDSMDGRLWSARILSVQDLLEQIPGKH